MKIETLKVFMARIKKEGRFVEFNAHIESVMDAGGVTKQSAIGCVRVFFPPLDGTKVTIAKINFAPPTDDSWKISQDESMQEIIGDCDIVKSIQWAGEHLYDEGVQKNEAPSHLAWAYYKWATGNEGSFNDFMKNVLSRLVPTNKALENAARMKDDGSEITDLLDSIRGASLG